MCSEDDRKLLLMMFCSPSLRRTFTGSADMSAAETQSENGLVPVMPFEKQAVIGVPGPGTESGTNSSLAVMLQRLETATLRWWSQARAGEVCARRR